MTRLTLYRTLGLYGVLGTLAALTLDGRIRTATLIFVGGITLKTWIAWVRDSRAD